jgi:hypothetical protein
MIWLTPSLTYIAPRAGCAIQGLHEKHAPATNSEANAGSNRKPQKKGTAPQKAAKQGTETHGVSWHPLHDEVMRSSRGGQRSPEGL